MSLKVSHHSSSLSDKSGKTLELDDNDCLFQVYMTQDLSFEEESPAFSQQLLDPEDGGTPNHEELAEVRPGGRDGKCSRNLDGPIEVFDRPQSPKVDLEPTNSIMNLCGSDDEPEASSPQVQLPELSPDSRNNPLDSLSGSTIVPHLDVPLRLGMEADSDKPATVCSAFDDTADPQPSLTQCDGESAAPATVHKIRSLNPKVWIDVLVGKSHRTGSFRSKNEHHQKVDIDENHEEVVESVRTRRRVRRVTRTSVIGRPQAPVNTHPELHVIPGEDPTLLARNELPVRHIDQFTFRDNEGAPVAVDVIDDPYCDVYVTGWVSPGLQEGGPARHIEAIQMTFECLEWGPWHVESGEPTIWLRSLGNAWYYLQKPAGSYAKMYEAFAFKTQLTALVIKAMTDSPNLEREAFLDYAIAAIQGDRCDDETLSPSRNQIMETLQSNVNALVRDIDNWFQKEIPKDVSEIPFWIELQEMADDIASSSAAKFKRSSDSNEKVLTERTLSIVTPLVAKVFQHFFVNCVDVVKRGVETEIDLEPTAVNVKKMDPVIVQPPRNLVTNVIEWCGDSYSVLNERDAYGNRTGRCLKRYYHSVIIDDITYEAGDTAFIRQEEKYDGGEPEASQAEPWFGQICYLFREKCTDMAHVRWLTHGKQSVLCEAASYNELMMLDECDDIPLATISGKPIVRYLGPDEEEPSDVERDFFYRYLYDSENASFVDAPPPSIDPPARAFADTEIGHCAACQQKLKLSDSDRSFWSADGTKERALQSRAVEYRINDFVYVVNDSPAEPYMIAQILEFSTQKKSRGLFKPNRRRQCERENDTSDFEVDDDIPSDDAGDVVVKLRLFLRSSNILAERDHAAIDEEGDTVYIPPAAFRDVRRVHVTSKTIKVVPDQLEGHCWVQHRATISDLNAFKDELDSFWFDDAVKIGTGNIKQRFEFESIDEKEIVGRADRAGLRTRDVEGRKAFVQDAKPLVALDLFAGAGGLTEGLDSLGFIQTKYAVEFSSSAGTTFKHNFPDATVYVKCANLLLDRAIRVQEGGEILDVIRDESGKILPPLPLKGDVNFIYCGPSCQGFSGLNHNKRVDDVKNTLVATSLSYTDFYRPDYFLLENVKGMADFKLGGVQQGRSIVGGIKMGVVKLILKTLHAMNYQTRFGLLQAGSFGLPQSRRRLFIWGAKRGLTLPDLPMTTHVSHCKAGNALDIQGNGVIKRFEPDSRSFRNAPLPAVTVWDAISDLPPFEFEAPVRSQSLKKYQLDALQSSEIYLKKRKLRRKHPIPSFPVADAQPVGLPSLPYTLPPLNEYQRSLRGSATTCTNHQTTAFGDLTVARIICVPYSRGADHRHLPSALAINRDINGPFTRMDPTHQFPVVTTAIHCAGKFGAVLHPIQDRIATARERARAQGFPDRFVFRAEPNKRGAEKVTDIYRQIGNAVPPPLARALGRRLLVAVRKDRGVGQLNRNDTALEETTVVAAPAPEARPSLTCPTAVSLTPDVLPAAPVLFPPSAQTSSGSIAIPRKLVPRPRKTEVYIDLTTPSPVRKSSSTPTSIRPHRFSIPSASASPATVSNLVAPSPHPPPPSKKRRSTVEIVIDVSPKRRR